MLFRRVFFLLMAMVVLSFCLMPSGKSPVKTKPSYTGVWYEDGKSLCGYEITHRSQDREVVIPQAECEKLTDLLLQLAKIGNAATSRHDDPLWYEHNGRWRMRLRSTPVAQRVESFALYETTPWQPVIAGVRFRQSPIPLETDQALKLLMHMQWGLIPEQPLSVVPHQIIKDARNDRQWYVVEALRS